MLDDFPLYMQVPTVHHGAILKNEDTDITLKPLLHGCMDDAAAAPSR